MSTKDSTRIIRSSSDALKFHELESEKFDRRKTGGLAAMLALCALERIADEEGTATDDIDDIDKQLARYYGNIELAIKSIVDAAGHQSPYLDGFIATLAEFIYFYQTVGRPNLVTWRSDASMSEAEIVLDRAGVKKNMQEGAVVNHG